MSVVVLCAEEARSGRLVSSYRGGRNRFLEAYITRDLEKLLEADTP